MSTAGLTEPER